MAATSIHCCLNVSPPNPSPPSPSKPTLAPWPPTTTAKKEGSWRSRYVSTAACVIVGSAVVFAAVDGGENSALAGVPRAVAETQGVAVRWSDKRKCPPWQANSLESIVPENLPRPSGRRRSETVGLYRNDPPVGYSIGTSRSSCYSL